VYVDRSGGSNEGVVWFDEDGRIFRNSELAKVRQGIADTGGLESHLCFGDVLLVVQANAENNRS
jgi:hypothetical protein